MDDVDVLERLQAIADTCKYLHDKGDEACFNELSEILDREVQEAVDAGLIDDPFAEEGSSEEGLDSPEDIASGVEDAKGNDGIPYTKHVDEDGFETDDDGAPSEEDDEDVEVVLSDGEKKSRGCVSDETQKNILDVLRDTRF